MMKKTLADISKQIGISTATISRVINNEGNVTQKTRNLVEQALKENNYQYRARRKSVERRNSDTVLIIAGHLQNPVTVAYIDGIRTTLDAFGKRAFVSLTDYSETKEHEYLAYAKANGFAGIFMLNALECDELIKQLKEIDAPVIFVNRYLRAMDTDIVTVDNYRSGYVATDYLIKKGHTRIAHLAGPQSSITCYNRMLGYCDAMRSAGLEIPPEGIFYADRDYDSGFRFGEMIADMPQKDRYSAVFCTAGLMAEGMVDALDNKGIKVPDDISLVCSDESQKKRTSLRITSVEQDPQMMGRAAAELFIERLRHPSAPPKRIVYPPVLIEHASVKPL